MWKCECGWENDDDFLFCAKCGEPGNRNLRINSNGSVSEDSSAAESEWRCACGCLNSDAFSFCANCGSPRPKEEAATSDSTATESSDWWCSCGCLNEADYLFCKTCGKARPEGDAEIVRQQEFSRGKTGEPAEPSGWKCSCGSMNDADFLFCRTCGKERPKEKAAATPTAWKCSCGRMNGAADKFCETCGKKRPSPERKRILKIIAAVVAVACLAVAAVMLLTRPTPAPPVAEESAAAPAQTGTGSGSAGQSANIPVRNDNWAELYLAFLQNNPVVDCSGLDGVNTAFCYDFYQDYYALADLDRDGEPELLSAWGNFYVKGEDYSTPQPDYIMVSDIENGAVVPKLRLDLNGYSRLVEVNRRYLSVDVPVLDNGYSGLWFVTLSSDSSEAYSYMLYQFDQTYDGGDPIYTTGDGLIDEDRFFELLAGTTATVELRTPEYRAVYETSTAMMEADWEQYCADRKLTTWSSCLDEIYLICLDAEPSYPEPAPAPASTPAPTPSPTPTPAPTPAPAQQPLRITSQPRSQSVAVGECAIFTVEAEGSNVSYYWTYRKNSEDSWHYCSGDCKSASLSITASEQNNGYQYRCLVSSAGDTIFSDSATLAVLSSVKITKQPASQSVKDGETAKFSVKADGSSLKYQWQYRSSSTASWSNCTASGNQTATVSVAATTAKNGFYYRCKITSGSTTVYSDTVTLTVIAVPGAADLVGVSSKLVWPDKFADSYTTKYVKTRYGNCAYLRVGPTSSTTSLGTVNEAAMVTVIATQNGYSLCVVTTGVAGWVASSLLVDRYY